MIQLNRRDVVENKLTLKITMIKGEAVCTLPVDSADINLSTFLGEKKTKCIHFVYGLKMTYISICCYCRCSVNFKTERLVSLPDRILARLVNQLKNRFG